MITTIFEEWIGKKRYIIADARSTDEKPTEDIVNGSIITEIDTGKVKKFDEEKKEWTEQ